MEVTLEAFRPFLPTKKKRVVLLPTSGEMFTGAMAVAKARAARFYCGNAKSCIFVVIANVRFSLACLI